MEHCPACGAEKDESAAFCRKCGKPLSEAGSAAPATEQPQPTREAPQPTPQAPEPPDRPDAQGTPREPGPLDVPLPLQPPPYPPTGLPGNLPGFGYQLKGVPARPPVYAGFWIRLLAFAIDVIIVGLVFSWPLRFVGSFPKAVFAFAGVLYLGAFFTYFILMTGHFGQTLGQMALRLKVVRQDMTTVDYRVAAVREFSMILSAIICYVGFFMAGFDSHKRALHDMIARTYVLRY